MRKIQADLINGGESILQDEMVESQERDSPEKVFMDLLFKAKREEDLGFKSLEQSAEETVDEVSRKAFEYNSEQYSKIKNQWYIG